MPFAWVAAPLLLIAVLAVSGGAKLGDAPATLRAMVSLRLPAWLIRRWIAVALPWFELALAVGLLVLPGVASVACAVLVLMLFVAYWIIVVAALLAPAPADCGCFGSLGATRVSRRTLVRNTVLLGLAVVAVAGTASTGGVPDALFSLGAEAWWLLALACAAGLVWLVVAQTDAPSPAALAAPDAPSPVAPATEPGDDFADYLRAPIPFATLVGPDGEVVTLRDLAATRARLLLFLSGGCGSCVQVATRVPAWERDMPEIGVHVVFSATDTHAEHSMPELVKDAYREDSSKASRILGIAGSPAAVLLGADGMLAGGPEAGEGAVIEFVEQIGIQLAEARG